MAWPLWAPIQEPCASVMEESQLEVVVGVVVAAAAVVVAVLEVLDKAAGAESGEDRRGLG